MILFNAVVVYELVVHEYSFNFLTIYGCNLCNSDCIVNVNGSHLKMNWRFFIESKELARKYFKDNNSPIRE